MAQMLGVQRSTVTIEARRLAAANLIDYRRGDITLTDRDGLVDSACECYAVLQRQFELLGTFPY